MKSSREDARRWLAQAENDLAAANVMLREGFYAQACFMAQQTAEKALQALAYNKGERRVTSHSLQDLLSGLQGSYPQLSEHSKSARTLDQYYVATRYPDVLAGALPSETYDQEQAEDAVTRAEGVVDLAKGIIGADGPEV